MSDTRQHAHQLIDRMPETQASGLVQFLETIIDPVATALRNAPLDDEPRADDEKPLAEAKTWLQKNGGKGIPHAEAMRRLGLELMEIKWTGAALEDVAALDKGIARRASSSPSSASPEAGRSAR
jgi:hypothetical protein